MGGRGSASGSSSKPAAKETVKKTTSKETRVSFDTNELSLNSEKYKATEKKLAKQFQGLKKGDTITIVRDSNLYDAFSQRREKKHTEDTYTKGDTKYIGSEYSVNGRTYRDRYTGSELARDILTLDGSKKKIIFSKKS